MDNLEEKNLYSWSICNMINYSEYICFDINCYDSFYFYNCYLFYWIFLEIKNIYIGFIEF